MDRIESEGIDEYKRIKELAKVDDNFQPYLEWFEGREIKISDHERLVQKKFTDLHKRQRPDGGAYRYCDIAEIAGCDRTTVSQVMNGQNQLSKEYADTILSNLEAYKENQ